MAAKRKYNFDLSLGEAQVIRHGAKDSATGEPYDQSALVRRIRRALVEWRNRAMRNAGTKKAAKAVEARSYEITKPSKARVEIRRVA